MRTWIRCGHEVEFDEGVRLTRLRVQRGHEVGEDASLMRACVHEFREGMKSVSSGRVRRREFGDGVSSQVQ